MSSVPVITDDDMQYYQFKARQKLLLEKEEIEWKEFCERTGGQYTSEQPSKNSFREIGIQVSGLKGKSVTLPHSRFYSQQTLQDFKTRLDNIEVTLAKVAISKVDEHKILQTPLTNFPLGNEDTRMKIIQDSLKASIKRLQSVLPQSMKYKSFNIPRKKEVGYFLTHDLQKQRAVARKAYLASLNKKNNQAPFLKHHAIKDSSQKTVLQHGIKRPILHKTSKRKHTIKSDTIVDNEVTSIETPMKQTEFKDLNIENATDAIIEDLLHETTIAFNRIKLLKDKHSLRSCIEQEEEKTKLKNFENSVVGNTDQTSDLSNWGKIRQHLTNLRDSCEKSGLKSLENETMQCPNILEVVDLLHKSETVAENKDIELPEVNIQHQTFASNCRGKKLFVNSDLAEKIQNHRNSYLIYLTKISRIKNGPYDPWALSNMVAESLLDDCVVDVCKELQDIPSSLVDDICSQEFLQTL